MVSAFVGFEGHQRCIVFLRHDLGRAVEIGRWYYPLGAMKANDADILGIEIGNALYDYLLAYCGIQEELNVAAD